MTERRHNLSATEALGRVVSGNENANRAGRRISRNVYQRQMALEISVQRLDLAPAEVSIGHGLRTAGRHRLGGWVTISVDEANQTGCLVRADPVRTNPCHANIVLPSLLVGNEECLREQAQALADRSVWVDARVFDTKEHEAESPQPPFFVPVRRSDPKWLAEAFAALRDAGNVAYINNYLRPSNASLQTAGSVLVMLHDAASCPMITFPTPDGEIIVAISWDIEKSAYFLCTSRGEVVCRIHSRSRIVSESVSPIGKFRAALDEVLENLGPRGAFFR